MRSEYHPASRASHELDERGRRESTKTSTISLMINNSIITTLLAPVADLQDEASFARTEVDIRKPVIVLRALRATEAVCSVALSSARYSSRQ